MFKRPGRGPGRRGQRSSGKPRLGIPPSMARSHSMPIRVTCPSCGKSGHIPDEPGGGDACARDAALPPSCRPRGVRTSPPSEGCLPLDLNLGEDLPLYTPKATRPGGRGGLSAVPPWVVPTASVAVPVLCVGSFLLGIRFAQGPDPPANLRPAGAARPQAPSPSPSVESPEPPRRDPGPGETERGSAKGGVAEGPSHREEGRQGIGALSTKLRESSGTRRGRTRPNSSVGSRESRDSLGSWIG